jgi:phosphatidate cytidylyltransferase
MTMPANLKKRLITGSALVLGITAILFGDSWIDHKPFLPFCMIVLALVTCLEAMKLFSLPARGIFFLVPFTLAIIILLQWAILYGESVNKSWSPVLLSVTLQSTPLFGSHVVPLMALTVLLVGFVELVTYSATGLASQRLANVMLVLLYLGLPPLFLMKLQNFTGIPPTLAIAATIFVPKLGDVGAYFTGSLIGKHKMTPTLSPKKTWEGFAGGLAVSVLTAIVINFLGREPLFKYGVVEAIAFGIVVGIAGVLGDLFESMLKRDAQAKDAASSLPGFGGVLDVVDSVLFAAPVAYLFFVLQ